MRRGTNGTGDYRVDPVRFLQVKKYGYNMFLLNKGIPYEGLESDEMIEGASPSSEATLELSYKIL